MYSDFIKRDNVVAVVGASRSPEKWGHRVYMHLRKGGFGVFPVNPKENAIEGVRCFPDLKSLPVKPDIVITVVRPEMTEKVLEEVRSLGIRMVWMQPGSESRKAVIYCKEHGIDVVYESCYVVDGLKESW